MTRKQPKRKRNPQVYWMRVEIEPGYKWPDELMDDATGDVANMSHVLEAKFLHEDTLMGLIETALHAEVTE